MTQTLSIEYSDSLLAKAGQAADPPGMDELEFLDELAHQRSRTGYLPSEDAQTALRFARGRCTDL